MNSSRTVIKKSREKQFDFRDFVLNGKKLPFHERLEDFSDFIKKLKKNKQHFYRREIISPADREVLVLDPFTGKPKKMLMFGSNNYLGLATHPYVREQVKKTVDNFGVGIGGPSLLNGYTNLMRQLEEQLSDSKKQEDTLIFSSGYNTNTGLLGGLFGSKETVFFDEYSHASFYDGLMLARVPFVRFEHNNTSRLKYLLSEKRSASDADKVVGVEGVYSMDGDLAPLDKIVPICKQYGAVLILDDAHGTGVMGENGMGTGEFFNLLRDIDITMGTFSKTFSVTGGFVSSSKPVINYLRYFARSYMFSASLPPAILAAVLAGIEVIRREPELRKRLHENMNYAKKELRKYNMIGNPRAGIISLLAPLRMDIRKAALDFHNSGIFLNAIEYPAVPENMQRFRISMMSSHTHYDLDRLIECVEKVWSRYV